MFQRLTKFLVKLVITSLLGGLLGATLVRFAPGFGMDARELDPRLSAQSLENLRAQRRAESNIARFYGRYLLNLAHGDLGFSHSLNQPTGKLLAERFPVTLRELGMGLTLGWLLGLTLAIGAIGMRAWPLDIFARGVSGTLLSIPIAVLAIIFVLLRLPVSMVIGLVVTPKIFGYSRNLLCFSYSLPHVLMARSKGLTEIRVFLWHVLPNCAPQLLALFGISVNLAFGAALPVEAICDLPGIGQLAWQAALARDLILLVNLTLLITLMTVSANSVSDLLGRLLTQGEA